MNNNFTKIIIIFLFIINVILENKQINFNKNKSIIIEVNQLKEKLNTYKELLGLYFEDKEKFYSKGREFIMRRKGNPFNETNSLTFKEKLNYLLIYESPEEKTNIVDKILLRNYSKKILGKDICTPILKIYNDIDEINLDDLPDKFVLKCNHGSGMNIFCKDKSKFNLVNAKHTLKTWMNINYGILRFEYQYMNIKKKVFAEKYLEEEIINYKFSCFNGEPKIIRVKGHINGTNIYNIYYTNWTITNFEIALSNYYLTTTFQKPKNLDKMIDYARLLASDFCYCRVDFYEINDKIYLGEITFTPFNSHINYKKKETEIYLGNLINISKIKKRKHK